MSLFYGLKVTPNTRWASSKRGFHIACTNIGNENLSLKLIAFVAFKARFVTAKPFTLYCGVS
jgi:hypothetical protein